MRTDRITKQPVASPEKSTQLHKDILRLGIAHRAEDRTIDELLKKLAKLPTEDKSQKIDLLLSDIVDAVIATKENRSKQDPFVRFALKLQQISALDESLSTQVNNILDGDRSISTAEALAKDLARTFEAPNPHADHLANFCTDLPIGEQLKREIFSFKDAILQGGKQADNLAHLETLVNELADALSADSSKTRTLDDESTLQSGSSETALEAGKAQLLELMNLIEFPRRLRQQADMLRKAIGRAGNTTSLETCLREVSSLVREMRASLETEISRLTEFLGSLTDRLDTLDQLIDSSSSFHSASQEHRNQLQHDIDQHVDSMRENIDTSTNLEEIRGLVSSRINKLSSHLSDYVRLETKRQHQATTQLNEMSQVVHALENQTEKLHEDLKQQQLQLQIDPLTKVLNRSGYNKILGEALQRRQRENTPFSLAVLDIDHFKKINDEFGHIAGDKVLTNLASQVKAHIRETDTLCRYGGEEFVILLNHTDGQTAHSVIEKLRAHIEQCHFHHGETTVPVTISCGVTACSVDDSVETIFERADEAMYRSKHSGRNLCTYAP